MSPSGPGHPGISWDADPRGLPEWVLQARPTLCTQRSRPPSHAEAEAQPAPDPFHRATKTQKVVKTNGIIACLRLLDSFEQLPRAVLDLTLKDRLV